MTPCGLCRRVIHKFLEEVWPSGKTKKGLSRKRFFENLYQRFLDYEEGNGRDDGESDDEIPIEESQFAYETDLRDYLSNNLHIIEDGLRLYISEAGEKGIEYIIPKTKRRIDILAIDKNNDYVVIELKVSRGYEKTIGQALYYQSMVKNTFDVEKARIILIAREISEELRMGTKYLPDVQLFEYQLSLTLNPI
ncbi:MAG: endonuclease NucS domain-containing protein [Nitrospirota bacterium]